MNDQIPTMTCQKTKIGKSFILAGDAILTIDNSKGTHFTFRIQASEPNERYPNPAYFVKLLSGPNNTKDYNYLGMLNTSTGEVRLTAKSKMGDDALSVKVIRWAFKILFSGRDLPEGYSIQHEGYCGKCAKLLTTPESVEAGFGPVCRKELGL